MKRGTNLSDRPDLVKRVSPVGFEILKSLAEYRYLTTNQFLDLGIAKDRGHLGKVLASFLSTRKHGDRIERKPREIGELDFGVKVGRGKLPRMYFLTKRGADLLEQLDPSSNEISYPPRVVQFAPDYEHRVRTVDFHISLSKWARNNRQDLVWFRNYFDWWPATRQARQHPVTRIRLLHKNIIPDAQFKLRSEDGIERLFCFEMANGMDTSRVIQQMREYCRGLDQGAINEALETTKAVRIIYVFEHDRLLELVQDRSRRDPWLQKYLPHFFLKTIDDIGFGNLRIGWHQLAKNTKKQSLF